MTYINDDVDETKNDKKNDDDDDDDDGDDHNDHTLEKMKELSYTLNNLVLEFNVAKTNKLIKEAVPMMFNDAVKQDRESSTSIVLELISREFVIYALKIIEELFKIHMKKIVLNVHPTTNLQVQVVDHALWDVLKTKFEKSSASISSCRDDVFCGNLEGGWGE
nr:hypothetical protein [Tanacetum cinerariifolium]